MINTIKLNIQICRTRTDGTGWKARSAAYVFLLVSRMSYAMSTTYNKDKYYGLDVKRRRFSIAHIFDSQSHP